MFGIKKSNSTITCPVCGTVLTSYVEVCPTCAYEIHLLPDNAPKAIIEIEERRTKLAKEVYAKSTSLNEENRNLHQLLAEKQQEVSSLAEQVASASAQVEKIKVDSAEALRLAEQAKDEAIRQAQAQSAVKEPVAYLIVKDGNTIVDLYGLCEGDNTFGYLPNEGTHHQVLYGDFMDRHFAIRVSVAINDRGRKRAAFTIVPMDGQVCMAPNGANLISGESAIEINAVVYVGDISFTLVENKNFK